MPVLNRSCTSHTNSAVVDGDSRPSRDAAARVAMAARGRVVEWEWMRAGDGAAVRIGKKRRAGCEDALDSFF